jgi:hypothetical protein
MNSSFATPISSLYESKKPKTKTNNIYLEYFAVAQEGLK